MIKKISFSFLISFSSIIWAKEEASIFTKNKYGFEEKTGSVRESSSKGQKDIYTKNKYGFEEKTGSLRKNSSGGFDIYKKNKYGLEEKVGSVKKE